MFLDITSRFRYTTHTLPHVQHAMRPDRAPSVLVTGGTGFVGSHLVEHLVSRGYEVVCLVRDPRRLRWLDGQKVRLVPGDCLAPDTLPQAVRGAGMVIHAAGLTKAHRVREYYRVNHDGTANLLRACAEHNPCLRKFVLVSSLSAAGPGRDEGPAADQEPPHPVSDYGRSKLLAEQEALRYCERFPVVIVRPTAVYGPRDGDVFELFRMASRGILLEIRGGERYLQWCHVADVAQALVLAAEKDVPSGSIYCIAEERVYSLTEFRDALLRSGGVQARVIRVPYAAAFVIGLVAELVGIIRGKATIMNRQKVREAVQSRWTCDVGRTERELGFHAMVSLEDGLSRTWAWYREYGWVRRPRIKGG